MDKVRLERLNDEIQQKEEMLQEARMEREKAVVELGREKDCNRVNRKNIEMIIMYFKIKLTHYFKTTACSLISTVLSKQFKFFQVIK